MRSQLAYIVNGMLRSVGVKSIQNQFSLSYMLILLFTGIGVVSLFYNVSSGSETVYVAEKQRVLMERAVRGIASLDEA